MGPRRGARPMRAAPALAALVLLAPAWAAPGALDLQYTEASQGLPQAKPGTSDDAGWTGVRFADVNADGWLDLGAIGRKGNGTRVFLGDGAGNWTLNVQGITPHFSGRSDLRFGDVNGDGHLDAVESMGEVWLGNGQGQWSAGAPLPLSVDGEDVALGDVDNDGDLDAAVVGHLTGGIAAFLNDGAGQWTMSRQGLPDSTSGGHKVDFADVDRDGCLDLLATYWYDGGAWFGDCAGHWEDRSEGLRGFQGWDVDAGDVDGDGAMDVVFSVFAVQQGDRGIRVYRGDGARNWTPGPVLRGAETWGGLAVEDVDGDGALDIVAGNTCFGSCTAAVRLWLGDGSGGFTEVEAGLPSGIDELEGLAAGDVDHSGVWDVGLAQYGEGGVEVWREDGDAAALGVRVLEPRGGEHWVGGGLRTIRWAAAIPRGDGPGTVDLAFSATGPSGPWVPIATGAPNSGAYAWRVQGGPSASAFVRVTVHAGGASASAMNPLPFGLDTGASNGPRVSVAARATPAAVAPEDPVAVQGEVRNEGFARVTGTLDLTVTRGGATLLAVQRGVDLAASGGALLDATWTGTLAERPGAYRVRATFQGQGEDANGTVTLGRSASASVVLLRPWLDVGHNLTAAAPPGQPQRVGFTVSNTGNLPAANATWTLRLPMAYAPVPDANRLFREAGGGMDRALAALFSQPPPSEVRADAANQSWVLTYRAPSLAPGAAMPVRFDVVPAVPGDHAWTWNLTYIHHYEHRAGPTTFTAAGQTVQRVGLPLIV